MTRNRQIVQATIRFLINLLATIEIKGGENIPETGGFIMSANHLSRMDAPVLISLPLRPDVTAFLAEKYEKHWFFGWFGRTMGFIFIDRSKADFSALRKSIEAIKQGLPLAVAPEGTRSKTGSLNEGKPGVILIAVKSGAPIIPAAVVGTDSMLHKIFTFRHPKVSITFGKPMIIPPLERENRDEQMQAWLEELMCRIALMLPAEKRGFYADHPRLKELLATPPD
jgi:1-acyl-sn-glycerol-3-phosphate acyltransferase